MIDRRLQPRVRRALETFPVVALIGPRQVGKTTLARSIQVQHPGAIYLDLEKPSDLARLHDPELYLGTLADRLVVLDEIHQVPDLFAVLRALVDESRRPGRFLILGSASPDLLRQSADTLAGRIVYLELGPFTLDEAGRAPGGAGALWLRGGYPQALLAGSDEDSYVWKETFIRTHLERDVPSFGLRVPSRTLERFWQMLAHLHGQTWNGAKLAESLGVSLPSARHYLDILEDTFMVRRIPPMATNLKKRLVKSPKVYLRDSGLLHCLLRIATQDELLGHPIAGASWEGWVVEQILARLPARSSASFYRTSSGAELDLVVERSGGRGPLAIEIKRSSSPKPTRGFWSALEDLGNPRAFIVCPVAERYPLGPAVWALPAEELATIDWDEA